MFRALLDHLSATIWSNIMAQVLQLDLPWLILRNKLVQEDTQGIQYHTMFNDYILDNSKLQLVSCEHIYLERIRTNQCFSVSRLVRSRHYGRFIHVERYVNGSIQFN
jgi:hypothetical protein